MIDKEKQERTQKRIQELIPLCAVYKGEQIAPLHYSEKYLKCWLIEKEWVESLADSYTNRNKYISYFKKRFNVNNITFHTVLNMPKSLFAFYMYRFDSGFIHEWIETPFYLFSSIYHPLDANELRELFMKYLDKETNK